MSLQTAADFIDRLHDDGRAAMRAVFAAREAEWKDRAGEPCTDQHVNGFVAERIRCRSVYR